MTTTNDLRNALAEDDGSLPERWNPDDTPDTTLIGTLLRFELIVTKLGEATIAVIKDEQDGTEYGVLLGRAVLKKRFDTLDPKPGDTIGLKYIGLVEATRKDMNPYHNYVMRVMHNAAAPARAATAVDDSGDDDLPF